MGYALFHAPKALIMGADGEDMEVYIELALVENFALDGVLLYLALRLTKSKVCAWRIILAATVGGIEAVVFPLLTLPVWAAYLIKLMGGILLCVLAVGEKKLRPYLRVTAAFFALTFLLGGALTAIYSFFDIPYVAGNGYLVEQAPVGLVAAVAVCLTALSILLTRRIYRFVKVRKNLIECVLTEGGREVTWQGFADSGNRLEFHGKPVCVVSPLAIFALFGKNPKAEGRMQVGTVHGARDAPVFTLERLTLRVGGRAYQREGVYLTVGEVGKEFNILLNTALMED